jgi:hypothetical protein
MARCIASESIVGYRRETGYTGFAGKRGLMRIVVLVIAAVAAISALAGAAGAATKKRPLVLRSASGTVIQPTRTIVHNPNGTTTVITVPRRSYLDVGTEMSPGETRSMDYAFPPAGDPGRPYWFYGPDVRGAGSFPIPPPLYIPGLNSSPQY